MLAEAAIPTAPAPLSTAALSAHTCSRASSQGRRCPPSPRDPCRGHLQEGAAHAGSRAAPSPLRGSAGDAGDALQAAHLADLSFDTGVWAKPRFLGCCRRFIPRPRLTRHEGGSSRIPPPDPPSPPETTQGPPDPTSGPVPSAPRTALRLPTGRAPRSPSPAAGGPGWDAGAAPGRRGGEPGGTRGGAPGEPRRSAPPALAAGADVRVAMARLRAGMLFCRRRRHGTLAAEGNGEEE